MSLGRWLSGAFMARRYPQVADAVNRFLIGAVHGPYLRAIADGRMEYAAPDRAAQLSKWILCATCLGAFRSHASVSRLRRRSGRTVRTSTTTQLRRLPHESYS